MALSILLVDDAGFIRSMLREILETEGGHRVVAEASDGAAALALQPELKPDLIISDIIMPGMDGIEMTRSLVASDPSVRVVVSAAHDQEGAVLRALAAAGQVVCITHLPTMAVYGDAHVQYLKLPAYLGDDPDWKESLRFGRMWQDVQEMAVTIP